MNREQTIAKIMYELPALDDAGLAPLVGYGVAPSRGCVVGVVAASHAVLRLGEES